MPFYYRLGQVPPKRHTQFRRPDGVLYTEELFGFEGFTGNSSLLYHYHPPVRVVDLKPCGKDTLEEWPQDVQRHYHLRTKNATPGGNPITGRRVLMFNDDCRLGIARPTEQMDFFYKNGQTDELYFIHEGTGRFETMFGTLPYREGDYVLLPHGTIYRIVMDEGVPQRWLVIEGKYIEPPKRYRNEWGQLLEHSPYCERDIHPPQELVTIIGDEAGKGPFEVWVKANGMITAYYYDHHPFDVVGWDGHLWPYTFNISDFEPITGRIHQPPPVHQTFQAHNFVVCSFVPRKYDYHPLSIPAPYNHSNIDSEEVLYYVNGNFMSRRGIDVASFTLHPHGIPHGPHPGAAEASIGKEATEELAVMVDTFRPLKLTRWAQEYDDPNYPYSWLENRKPEGPEKPDRPPTEIC
jgi:homogentisate 1,2-dioxygenase